MHRKRATAEARAAQQAENRARLSALSNAIDAKYAPTAASTIQTKLEVSEPGDPLEQEADRIARDVMRMPAPTGSKAHAHEFGNTRHFASGSNARPPVQRKCDECDAEDESGTIALQREAISGAKGSDLAGPGADLASGADFNSALTAARASGGEPLPGAVRGFMEPRFGEDFSGVRMHRDAGAIDLAHAVCAFD